ncbi:MAG: MGMT family protein [Candidatus Omnitrophota bacterium]
MKHSRGTAAGLDILKKDKSLTSFQRKVYRAALCIPKGEVRSYGWVARKIGMPRASRAVGQALKKNPYTVTSPCHRVICSDGTPGGYSKGVGKKKRLLKRECPRPRPNP